MSKKLTPAVAYLRKSTKGLRPDGKERQEKSISQQRAEIQKLAAGRYQIIRWLSDEGVSGWKRDGKRPQFDQLLREARERADFTAILCDDLDRFSRAEVMEVFADLSSLAAAGVRTIHCVNQGEYGLGENDIGRIIKMVVDVHGGNEFCRKLSRRVTLAHRNRAMDGKRAGRAPYGMENDGKGGLKHGDRKHLAVVRRIYNLLVERKRSMNSIAAELNKQGIPAPRGGKWYVASIKELVQRPVYKGEFAFGRRQQGRFFTTAKNGDVVEVKDAIKRWAYSQPVFTDAKAYTPVVSKKVWDEAQRILASFTLKGSRRPRTDGYPLAGILYCQECGKPMYGCHPTGREYRVYRCSTNAKTGQGTCPSGGCPEIREELILPWFLQKLAEGIDDITKLLSSPPDVVNQSRDDREARQKASERIAVKIKNLYSAFEEAPDPETRNVLFEKIAQLRAEKSKLDAEPDDEPNRRREELQALRDYWDDFDKRAISVPVGKAKLPWIARFHLDPETVEGWTHEGRLGDKAALLIEPRVANEMLHTLGARIDLQWKNRPAKLRNGRTQNRFELNSIWYRLGQDSGKLCGKDLVRFHKAEVAEPCNGILAAGRCDSRRGRG